jgi:hypothetical protein
MVPTTGGERASSAYRIPPPSRTALTECRPPARRAHPRARAAAQDSGDGQGRGADAAPHHVPPRAANSGGQGARPAPLV